MAHLMKIGIMSKEDFKQYTIDIAKGKIRPKEDVPKIWFESVESMAQILSTRNQELLRMIKEKKPKSLSELAITSGRKPGNLSRTLRTMERYGIISLSKEKGAIMPRIRADKFTAVFGF